MKIDFNAMEAKRIPNFKGGEKDLIAKIFADESGKVIYGQLEPGATIGLHTHDTSSEVIYMLDGIGTVVTDGVEETLEPGTATYCKKGHTHTLQNRSDSIITFLGVVPELG